MLWCCALDNLTSLNADRRGLLHSPGTALVELALNRAFRHSLEHALDCPGLIRQDGYLHTWDVFKIGYIRADGKYLFGAGEWDKVRRLSTCVLSYTYAHDCVGFEGGHGVLNRTAVQRVSYRNRTSIARYRRAQAFSQRHNCRPRARLPNAVAYIYERAVGLRQSTDDQFSV